MKTYRTDENWIVTPFELVSARQNAVADSLLNSWNSEPFVDVVVVDQANGQLASCPKTHPQDLFANVWPGTRHVCDCLEREKNRSYYLDMICEKKKG